jgi:2-hydroxy-3-keto-5-methylthiopentenyl-1-phosphate phosphatase
MRCPDNDRLVNPTTMQENSVSAWTILCDFDGTVAVDDTTDTLLDRFGRDGWEVLEADWRAGRINSHDCMAGQVALLDMDRSELDAHLDAREVDAAFEQFVRIAQTHGIHIEILSDGLDYAIHRILARNGLDGLPVTANALQEAGARKWRLNFPNASATCRVASGTCKCVSARRAHGARKKVLMIGDGASDFCVAESADFVFAKGKLIAHCIAKNIAHAPILDFADVIALLPLLLSGNLATAARDVAVAPKAATA